MERPLPPLRHSLAFIVPAEHIRFARCGQYSTTKIPSQMTRDFLRGRDRTRTARPRRRRGKQQPGGLLFSARFPIFRNVYQESTTCRSTVCRTSVGRYRTGTMYVRAIRKKQRQGITMTAVSCLLCYMARLGAIAAQVRTGRACTHVRSETVKLHIYGWSFDCEYGILHLENQLRQI